MCEGGVFGAGTVPERQDKGNITKWFRNTISGWDSRGRGAVRKYWLAQKRGYKTFVSEMAQKLLSEAGRGAAGDKKARNGHEILKKSSIKHRWEETNRDSLYGYGFSPEIIWRWAENAEEKLSWDAELRSWGDLDAYISPADLFWISPARTELCAGNLSLLRGWKNVPGDIKGIINLFFTMSWKLIYPKAYHSLLYTVIHTHMQNFDPWIPFLHSP